MKKILLLSLLTTLISSCFGKFTTYDTSYKKKYSLKFENFYKADGELWTEGKAELTADRGGFNLDLGKTAGTISAVFKITYNGGNILKTYPLSFKKVGLSEHYSFNIDDCTSRTLKDGETCSFKVIYTYSENDTLENFDTLDLLVIDSDKNESIDTNLFQLNFKGHRKVKGTLNLSGIENNEINFGSNDWNIEPAAREFSITNTGEFNIETANFELIGSDDLKPLFLVDSLSCINAVTCNVKVRFPSMTKVGNALENPVVLKLIFKMENADEPSVLDNIKLEGRRLSETNLVLYEADGSTPVNTLALNDLTKPNSIFVVKNIGETKTTNFSYTLDNSSSFNIDAISTCQAGLVLNGGETCNIKVNFINQAVGNFTGSIGVVSDRLENRVLSLTGKVYEPATVNISPLGVINFGSVVGAGNIIGESIVTLSKVSGEVPATISNTNIVGNNFYIDNTWVNADKCSIGTVLNNINDSCLVKLVFSPEDQNNYPIDLTATLNFSYLNGKGLTIDGSSVGLLGKAIKDAELNLNVTSLDFGSIIKDETKTLELFINNSGGIDVDANIELTNNTSFSIIANECTNPITPDETCKVIIKFNPNSVKGTFNSSLKVSYNNASGTTLEHIPSLLAASINPAILELTAVESSYFGVHELNAPAIVKNFLVKNIGDVEAVNVNIASFNTSFFVASSCPQSLTIGAECVISVNFVAPEIVNQDISDILKVNYTDRPASYINPINTSTVLGVSGDALRFSVDKGSITFISDESLTGVILNSFSQEQFLTYTNNGSDPINIDGFNSTITAEDGELLVTSNDCPSSLDVGTSCLVFLKYKPTNGIGLVGADKIFTASYNFLTLGQNPVPVESILQATVLTPAVVELRYNGVNISSLNFNDLFDVIKEGDDEKTVELTLVKTAGDVPAIIPSITLDGSNEVFSQTSNCSELVEDGDSCNISITFKAELNEVANFLSTLKVIYESEYSTSSSDSEIDLEIESESVKSPAVIEISEPNPANINFGTIVRGNLINNTNGDPNEKLIRLTKVGGNHSAKINNFVKDTKVAFIDNNDCLNFNFNNVNDYCDIKIKFVTIGTGLPGVTSPGTYTSQFKINLYTRGGNTNPTDVSTSTVSVSASVIKETQLVVTVPNNNTSFGSVTIGNTKNINNNIYFTISDPANSYIPNTFNTNLIQVVTCSNNSTPTPTSVSSSTINKVDSKYYITASYKAIEDQCVSSWDNVDLKIFAIYDNGINPNYNQLLVSLTGKSLTPAKLIFNRETIYNKNIDELVCYNYNNNGSQTSCNVDPYNQNAQDLIYNGSIINGGGQTGAISTDNLQVFNIGETNATVIDEKKEDETDPIALNIATGNGSCTSLGGITSYTGTTPNYATPCYVPEVTFDPKEVAHRSYHSYTLGLKYNNGVEQKSSLDDTLSDARKKIEISGTGLLKAKIKLQNVDQDGSLIDCSSSGTNCQFNEGEDIVYYKNQAGYVFNQPTNNYFALSFVEGDVPAQLLDPQNNSTSVGRFYYANTPYGTNGTCNVGDYIFSESNGLNLKQYCMVSLSFKYSDGTSTSCGMKETYEKLFKYYPFIPNIDTHAVYSSYQNQKITAGIRPTLSNSNGYCEFNFGANGETKTVTLKNYSTTQDLSINLNNINSYIGVGYPQNDFIVNNSTCAGVLAQGSSCDINITFIRNVETKGHAKFNWYNYRIPYIISSFINNLDIEAKASTFIGLPTDSVSNIKETKIGANFYDISSYYCYDCSSPIDILLTNETNPNPAVPLIFTSTNMYVHKNVFNNGWTQQWVPVSNNLFSYSVDGGSSFGSITLPASFYDGEFNYLVKATNPTTFIAGLGANIILEPFNTFNTFYGFTSGAIQFEFRYSSAFNVLSFLNGIKQNSLQASGSLVNSGEDSFLVSLNQLVQMCDTMDYKLFNPSGALYNIANKEEKYLTDDFKADCCGEELGIATSLNPAFCDLN